jgi:hypothetical protein
VSSSLGCGCDESKRLRAELAVVTAERDYMLTGLDPNEVRVMRQELSKEHDDGNCFLFDDADV